MSDHLAEPRVEDFESVGTRISWSAILAGTVLALGVYFLLATLGGAVGLSVNDRVSASTIQTGAVAWAFLITITALFLGGLATSLFTVGENKIEAVTSGLITWALLFAVFLALGSVGVRAGFNSMNATHYGSSDAASRGWENGARAAGVPEDQIARWRSSQATAADGTIRVPESQQITPEEAKRYSWYAFGATWLSMLAAAAGAFVGCGPTFRIVLVSRANVLPGQLRAPATAGTMRT